jgi:hypothetical protein
MMNPRTVLQERYPLADFTIYFRHLDACRTSKSLNTHDHHICPKAQFPEYKDLDSFPENSITLTIDDHSFAHKLLEAACGIKAPSTALFEATAWTPERCARHSELQIAVMNRPEVKARNSAAQKVAQTRPEVKERVTAASRAALTSETRSAAAKQYWNSPEGRLLNAATQKRAKNRPEQIKRASHAAKAYWKRHKAELFLADALIAEVAALGLV